MTAEYNKCMVLADRGNGLAIGMRGVRETRSQSGAQPAVVLRTQLAQPYYLGFAVGPGAKELLNERASRLGKTIDAARGQRPSRAEDHWLSAPSPGIVALHALPSVLLATTLLAPSAARSSDGGGAGSGVAVHRQHSSSDAH
jgi:hypothetical protein